MLLIGCSILFTAVGFANTIVNERPCSDQVILVDNVLDIENQATAETAFDLKKSTIMLVNTNIVLYAYECEGGKSPPMNVVEDLQVKNKKKPIKARFKKQEGASYATSFLQSTSFFLD